MPVSSLSLVATAPPPRRFDPGTGNRPLLSRAADALHAGVMLFDANAAVIAANAAARGLLREALDPPRDGADAAAGATRLRLSDTALQSRLEAAVRATARLGADPEAGARTDGHAPAFVIRAEDGRPRVSLRLSPVAPSDDSPIRVARLPTVLGLLVDHGRVPGPDPRLLHDLFDLGEASARVAVACLHVDGVKDIAARLGVSANTVKTHLLIVYRKTGCTRRSQLVRLLSTLDQVRPVRPPSGD